MKLRAFLCVLTLCAIASNAHSVEVRDLSLKNGAQVWMVASHELPLVTFTIAFTNAGYATDPADKQGRAYLAARMLNEGSVSTPSRPFKELLEQHAIQWATEADDDTIRLQVTTLKEHLPLALRLVKEALHSPRYDAQDLARVREQTRTALTMQEETPSYRAGREFSKLLFADHPYSHYVMGTHSGLARITAKDLKQFHVRYFTRANLRMSVVGDVTVQEVESLRDALASALPDIFAPPVRIEDIAPPETGVLRMIEMDVPQSTVMFGAGGMERSDPDFMAAFILNHIVGGGGGLTSRLMQELREKHGLVYHVDTALSSSLHTALLTGSLATKNEDVHTAIAEVKSVFATVVNEGVTAQELDDAKRYLKGVLPLKMDNNRSLAQLLMHFQLQGLTPEYLNTRSGLINAVTLEQVHRVAARLFPPERFSFVVVGKKVTTEP